MNPRSRLCVFGTTNLFLLTVILLTELASAQAPVDSSSLKPSQVDSQDKARLAQMYDGLPLSFEPNLGQTDPQVKFVARGEGFTLFLTNTDAVLRLGPAGSDKKERSASNAIVRMKLSGANHEPGMNGVEELPGKSDYFIGNDPQKWRAEVPHYARVRYQNIYPGVDLIYYGNQGDLEYDFVVAPGADAKTIRWNVDSVLASQNKRHATTEPLRIDGNGDLVVGRNGAEIRFPKPVAYQDIPSASTSGREQRKFIDAQYVLEAKDQVSIRLRSYDTTWPLTIDPVVWFSSYLGGSSTDQASAIAVDREDNVYLAGYTQSLDFPKVNQIPGACQSGCDSGNDDAFVTKISASGKLLLYSIYLGGSGGDSVAGIAVDGSANVYVTGGGNSSDFPRVNQIAGACNGTCGNGSNNDAFVTKINAAGNALVYSSVIGGSGDENDGGFAGIALDSSGNAYLTGNTSSSDFPRIHQIAGACNGTCGSGSTDAFVTKVNAAGSALVYSSYLGGSGTDLGFGIAVDGSGSAYATGLIGSTDFPRVNQISGGCNGSCGAGVNYDVYVTKINAAGNALVYSSYLGGSDSDYGRGIAVDSSGNAYLAGRTSSTDFPVMSQIPGACVQNSCSAFAAKINAAGSALVYSSRFGGSGGTGQAHAIAVDSSGNAYVTGEYRSSDFPQVHPILAACRGTCGTGDSQDGFVVKIDAAGDAFTYSSNLGGSGDDNGGSFVCNSSIAVDSSDNAYLSGCTSSADFPRVPKSIPGACNGSCGNGTTVDGFVMKISP